MIRFFPKLDHYIEDLVSQMEFQFKEKEVTRDELCSLAALRDMLNDLTIFEVLPIKDFENENNLSFKVERQQEVKTLLKEWGLIK